MTRFAHERTDAGDQSLVPGVAPNRLRDRPQRLADAPMLSRKAQKPADHGLFDLNARLQLDLF